MGEIGPRKIKKRQLIKDVRTQVGDNKVICALSGGVDSSVVAQLLNKAIGKKLYCIFVNTGLLRKNEEVQVCLLYTSPSPRDTMSSRMPSSA